MPTSFRNGMKYVDGTVYCAVRHVEVLSSNGHTVYTASLWQDGTTSCNCPGWAMRKRCRHEAEARKEQPSRPATRQTKQRPKGIAGRLARGIDL
jgi:hypothetical protein